MLANIDILIPLKAAGLCKQRLASRLDARQRDSLVNAMASDVLSALMTGGVQMPRVHLVSESADRQSLAARFGAGFIRVEPHREDALNSVLRQAISKLDVGSRQRLCVLFADLPMLTAADVACLCQPDIADVQIYTDRTGAGTNALVGRAGTLPIAFGQHSLQAHQHACQQAGLAYCVRMLDGVTDDIDQIADLDALIERAQKAGAGIGSHTMAWLRAMSDNLFTGTKVSA